jgi:membrane-associated phospholipid phosphatase
VKKNNIEVDMPVKEDRFYPLLLIIFCFLVGLITLYFLGAPAFTMALVFCYLSNTILVFFINLHWKISIHAMGVAGPAAAMIYLFGIAGFWLTLLLPAVMWSRVYLKRHSVGQVVYGSLIGFFWTYAQLYILLSL